jgi:hypothetical protein
MSRVRTSQSSTAGPLAKVRPRSRAFLFSGGREGASAIHFLFSRRAVEMMKAPQPPGRLHHTIRTPICDGHLHPTLVLASGGRYRCGPWAAFAHHVARPPQAPKLWGRYRLAPGPERLTVRRSPWGWRSAPGAAPGNAAGDRRWWGTGHIARVPGTAGLGLVNGRLFDDGKPSSE